MALQVSDPLNHVGNLRDPVFLLAHDLSGEEKEGEVESLDAEFRKAFNESAAKLSSVWGDPFFFGTW